MRTLALLIAGLLLAPPVQAQRYARATTIGTVDSVRSTALDESRPYIVYTPPSYDDTLAAQRYPVLYILDGDAHFHAMSGLVQILGTGVNGTYVVPEMIVVAIPNTGGNRTRDLTPTHSDRSPDGTPNPGFEASGGGPAFLTFVRDELIPRIETQYRTTPFRVFVGHSFGGITTLNALYTMPDVFNAYVAIDPSLWWDDRVLLHRAKDYFASARLQGKALYVAQANTINPADTARNLHFESITNFNAVMGAYDRSGIRYGFRYYDQDDHGSVPMIAEYDALRFIFEGYRVPLLRVIAEPAQLTRHFRDVSERLGAPFQPSVALLNQFGRVALSRDTANAEALGRMAMELYPRHAGAYELLGDIAAARGQTAAARRWYEQVLERQDRPGVREKLAKLAGEG